MPDNDSVSSPDEDERAHLIPLLEAFQVSGNHAVGVWFIPRPGCGWDVYMREPLDGALGRRGTMAGIVKDAAKAADWIASALNSSGYTANFSADSLAEVDRFFEEHSKNGAPKKGGLLTKDTGQRLFAIGAYTGEVLRRSLGGDWQPDPSDPDSEMGLSLVLPNGTTVWPVERVMKRYTNGREDSIAAYGAGLGLNLTVFTDKAKRGFRRCRRD